MKVTALLIAAVYASDCECAAAENLPEDSWFTDQDYASGYGQTCEDWDSAEDYCQEDGDYADEDYCVEGATWCYVDADVCDDAEDTTFFADTDYSDLQWSFEACGYEASASSAFATMLSAAAVVAATI